MVVERKCQTPGYIGLKGEEIDIAARIAAIADVFDAICSKRCYKSASTCEEALSVIFPSLTLE